jgi:hypothetical protein
MGIDEMITESPQDAREVDIVFKGAIVDIATSDAGTVIGTDRTSLNDDEHVIELYLRRFLLRYVYQLVQTMMKTTMKLMMLKMVWNLY